MKRFLFIFVALILVSRLQAQRIFYVSPSGNDASANPSNINTPWRTFAKACSTATAGDKVYFRGGTYNETYINFPNSGNANQYIEFLNYPNEEPIFDGNAAAAYFVLISSKNYVRIKGFHFKNLTGSAWGIKIEGTSHHLELKKCKFSQFYASPNAGFNPFVVCGSHPTTPINAIVVDSCSIFDCRTGVSEALTFVGNVDGFLASNNHINNTGNIGIVAAGYYNWCNNSASNSQARNGIIRGNLVENCKSPIALAAGIYVDGGKNIVVEQNTCRNGQRGFQINCENQFSVVNAVAEKVIIRNNLAYNNSRGGIGLGGCKETSWCKNGRIKDCWIINNTCVNNYNSSVLEPSETSPQDYGELNLDYSENCTIRNNIFYSSISGRSKLLNSWQPAAQFLIGLSADYNIWHSTFTNNPHFMFEKRDSYGLQNFKTNESKDQNSRSSNPLFQDVASANFRLSSESSPAYDFSDLSSVATDSAGSKDLAGKTRVKNFRPDAGAYEYQCPTNDIVIDIPLTYKTYLFETNGRIIVNKSVNPAVKVVFNAKKSVLFQNGAILPSTTKIETKNTGCSN